MLIQSAVGVTPTTPAVHINLSRSGAYVFPEAFNPAYTYAIFNEEELIPGYKDLKISITFQAHDLKPKVEIKYGQKMAPLNDEMKEIMDIEGALKKFLPESIACLLNEH